MGEVCHSWELVSEQSDVYPTTLDRRADVGPFTVGGLLPYLIGIPAKHGLRVYGLPVCGEMTVVNAEAACVAAGLDLLSSGWPDSLPATPSPPGTYPRAPFTAVESSSPLVPVVFD